MSNYPDSSPSSGAKAAKGIKNDDGRLKGSENAIKFNDKAVDAMPNEGAPSLPKVGGDLV